MYILLSLYLPTHLILLRLSLPPPCLSTPPLLHFPFFFTAHSLFLLSLPFFYSECLSSLLSLYSLYSPFSVTPPYFLALLFPIYASLFISLFLFLPFFLLPHWLFSLPPFFFPSSSPSPPPPLSFFIRPLLGLIRPFNALSPHRPLDGSHFPFRSPLFPPIIFFSPLSSLFFDIPILIFFFPVIIATYPAPPTLALSLGPITPFVFPFFPSNRHPSSPFSPFRLLLSPPLFRLFCPPNGSHYSFCPCPSSIQSWSSLPPSSPSMPFPLPPFILFPMSDPFFSA